MECQYKFMITKTKEITIGNKTYYVDGLPKHLQKKDHATGCLDTNTIRNLYGVDTINIYHHKNMTSEDDLASINGWFDGIKQPTESQVRRAMILIVDENYMIKSGGGSGSDHLFSSSFTLEIAHPITGEDTKVLVMKKYSSVFEDVLITADEISKCYKACMSTKQKTSYRLNQIQGLIGILFRNELGRKVKVFSDNGVQLLHKETIKKLLTENLINDKKVTRDEIDYEINRLQEIYREESLLEIVEDQEGINKTERNRNDCLNKIQVLDTLRNDLTEFKSVLK